MSMTKTPRRICAAENDLKEFQISVRLEAPALADLLDQLVAGKNPDPLDVMSAISQGVEFLTRGKEVRSIPQACGISAPGRVCSSC